ncbi:MAG: metal ABC transporter permease [Burkholderiaceae bacterium]
MENYWWMLAPMAAGILVLASHIPLGRQVLTRGIVFIDLAIAQTAAVGVLIGESFGGGALIVSLSASGFAIIGAMLVAWLSRAWPARREALIGLLYVGAASVTIFWVSSDAHGVQRVSSLLSGDVLWTTWPAMLPLFLATVAYRILLYRRPDAMARDWLFYPSFAILVSLSVPLLGLYLVFVCLIVPALWIEHSGHRVWSSIAASAVFVTGVLVSFWFDWPTGTTVVIIMILSGLPFLLASLVSSKKIS